FLVWLVSFYRRFRARWDRADSNCYDDGIHPSKAAFADKRYFAYRISFGRGSGCDHSAPTDPCIWLENNVLYWSYSTSFSSFYYYIFTEIYRFFTISKQN